ncbi:MAG TPA: hypothetical protein VN920_13995 [Pyrinomonadaceae bacterium]|nr:hypothetical protein [Pyrinomonadaceae bacterium]
MSNGNPIIIKGGGSIAVTLYKDTFPQDSVNAEKHYCANRRITRVTITDDNTKQVTSCAIPDNGKCTISIEHSL